MKVKQIILLCSSLFLTVSYSYAQTVSTYAGTGSAGTGTNGVVATNSQISNPYGIVVDADDNIYFADQGNNRIAKIDVLTHIITTLVDYDEIGNQLKPVCLTIENDTIFFINQGLTTSDPYQLLKVGLNQNQAASVYTFLDLNIRSGIHKKGNTIYLSNTNGHTIEKYVIGTSANVLSTISGVGGTNGNNNGGISIATFKQPSDLILDGNGNLIVCDLGNNLIRKINLTTNQVSTLYGTGGIDFLTRPQGIEMLNDGTFYIATQGNKIKHISPTGVLLDSIGTGEQSLTNGIANLAEFNHPVHIVFNSINEMFITDKNNHAIRKVICTAAQPPSIYTSIGTEEYCIDENTSLKIYVNTIESDLAENIKWVWHKETCDGPVVFTGISYDFNPTQDEVLAVRAEGGCIQNGQCQIIKIKTNNCSDENSKELQVYNTFTPNEDGINDAFEIVNLPDNSLVMIYNKWGDLIYKKENYDNIQNPWKGKNNFGKKLAPGTYYYTIEKNNNNVASGWVQLIR